MPSCFVKRYTNKRMRLLRRSAANADAILTCHDEDLDAMTQLQSQLDTLFDTCRAIKNQTGPAKDRANLNRPHRSLLTSAPSISLAQVDRIRTREGAQIIKKNAAPQQNLTKNGTLIGQQVNLNEASPAELGNIAKVRSNSTHRRQSWARTSTHGLPKKRTREIE